MENELNRRLRLPSDTFDRFWLVHIDVNYRFKRDKVLRKSGKWLIFDSVEKIDQIWPLIIDALDEGMLGPSAKVSTAKVKRGFETQTNRVICVFTEDFNNFEDVRRVEAKLRDIGVKTELVYKLDADAGKYEQDGFDRLVRLRSAAVE